MSHLSMSNLHYYREASVSKDVLRETTGLAGAIARKIRTHPADMFSTSTSSCSIFLTGRSHFSHMEAPIHSICFPPTSPALTAHPLTQRSVLPHSQHQPNKCKQQQLTLQGSCRALGMTCQFFFLNLEGAQ